MECDDRTLAETFLPEAGQPTCGGWARRTSHKGWLVLHGRIVNLACGKPSRASHNTMPWHQVWHGGVLYETGWPVMALPGVE